jgi:hypothetical protein
LYFNNKGFWRTLQLLFQSMNKNMSTKKLCQLEQNRTKVQLLDHDSQGQTWIIKLIGNCCFVQIWIQFFKITKLTHNYQAKFNNLPLKVKVILRSKSYLDYSTCRFWHFVQEWIYSNCKLKMTLMVKVIWGQDHIWTIQHQYYFVQV